MATINVSPPGTPTLRQAINGAAAGDIILLADGLYNSVGSLAKQTSVTPLVQTSDYTVKGSSETGTVIKDTRIFQTNVDGLFAPETVSDLTLDYTALGAADGGALLRATSGAYLVSRVTFRGAHRGWDGNGNLYMSLTSFSAAAPITVDLTLDDVTVAVTGQLGFNPVTGTGGSAFLHSWNNNGNVQILNSTFDEAGFLSSFNILAFPGFVQTGLVTISGNTFTRSLNTAVVREQEGNRLANIAATLTGNTFDNGSYLDLYDVSQPITLTSNTFSTIANGFGIRITGPTVGVAPSLTGVNDFTGRGLPLKYVDANANKSVSLIGNVTVVSRSYTRLTAGGQGNDNITLASGFLDWVNGDDGNDSINSGDLSDYLSGGGGDDTLIGGSANDILVGGLGADVLTGGTGNDSYAYNSVLESGNSVATRDIITDFAGAGAVGGDVINVRAIDANPNVPGSQSFTFIGTASFTDVGQLRYFQSGGNTFVEANAASQPLMSIQVNGLQAFVAADFSL